MISNSNFLINEWVAGKIHYEATSGVKRNKQEKASKAFKILKYFKQVRRTKKNSL